MVLRASCLCQGVGSVPSQPPPLLPLGAGSSTPRSPPATPATPAGLLVQRAAVGQRPLLARMLELYQHELSDIWPQELDAQGEYGYALDRYWADPDCHAFVATLHGHPAGFALVDAAVRLGPAGHWMDQFFVLKRHRRNGLGRAMALQVVAALPGAWEVGQMPDNLGAQAFWRRLVSEHTAGHFAEQRLTTGGWQGLVQRFHSGAGG